jgi:hypothetical protein
LLKPKGVSISFQRLQEAHEANPDGFGMMWAFRDSLFYYKDTQKVPFRYITKFSDDIILHFRTASSGTILFDACHPHFVNDNLAFVHNGNLFEFSNYFGKGRTDKLTDTQRFNNDILKKLPPGFLDHPEIRKSLEHYCKENFSKMIFMDSGGKIDIINEPSGVWEIGCWFSNGGIENYIGYGYSGAYPYHENEIRHRGGLISVEMFNNKGDWIQCESCLGWYQVNKMAGVFCKGCLSYINLKKWMSNEDKSA